MHSSRKQRGAVLIVALIFLVVMTMLILASIRGTVMQERMASNLYDRSLAFQAAEAALREGERFVLESSPKPTGTGCDSSGNCSKPDPDEMPAWEDEDNWDDAHRCRRRPWPRHPDRRLARTAEIPRRIAGRRHAGSESLRIHRHRSGCAVLWRPGRAALPHHCPQR